MRVTSSNLYQNFIYNQQEVKSSLNRVTEQISSGKKISTIYDNPTVFTNALRLDQEESSLKSVKDTSKSAQTFADQTDGVLSDFTSTLDKFKAKLVEAANSTNSKTSYNAIANELKEMEGHLKNLANTSINGKFLFSGTAFGTKPIDADGKYHGNGEHVKAKIGSGLNIGYNIDGKSLFLGRDNDYAKHMSLNVIQYDKMKENPEFVVEQDGKKYIDRDRKAHGKDAASDAPPEKDIVTDDTQIRALTGVNDVYNAADDTYSDGTSYFYVEGRKPDGATFKEKFSLTNSASVDDLKEKIGNAFGNRANNKAVDVSLNKSGELEIKDTTTGKLVTDFSMVASDKDESDINAVVSKGDYVVNFNKSHFNSIRDVTGVKANNMDFDNSKFEFNTEFKRYDNENDAKKTDTLKDVLYKDEDGDGNNDLDHIKLTGTDTDGNAVDKTLSVSDTTTVKDLEDEIKNDYGDVTVSLAKGKITIIDNTLDDKTDSSKLSIKMDAQDSNDNSLAIFARKDGAQSDKTYFQTEGSDLKSDVSQVNKKDNTFATKDTRMIDVSGDDSIDPKTLKISLIDIDGNKKDATITLRDKEVNGHKSTFTIGGNTYDIYDNEGNLTPIHDLTTSTTSIDPATCKLCTTTHTTKGMTYGQLSNVVSMMMADKYPASNSASDEKAAVAQAKEIVGVGLDEKGRLQIDDKKNATTKLKFGMYDSDTDDSTNKTAPVFTFNSNDAVTIDSAKLDIFSQMDKMIDDVRAGKVRADSETGNPRTTGIQGALELIDHIQDHVIRKHTEIGSISNTFENSIERNSMLIVHTETLKSDVLDTDLAQASMNLQKLTLNYQAMLATISKVNSLSLVKYMG